MTVNELIARLQGFVENGHGDLSVFTSDMSYGYCGAESVALEKDKDEYFILVK